MGWTACAEDDCKGIATEGSLFCEAHSRPVKTPKVVPGRVFGYYLETDEFVIGGTTLSGCQPFDMFLGPLGRERLFRYSIPLRKYETQIYKASQEVTIMNLPIEKITIFKGVVQAHPPVNFHWRCPFCYPEEPESDYKVSEPVMVGAIPPREDKPVLTTEKIKELLKEQFCKCKPPLPTTKRYSPWGDANLAKVVCSSCGFRREPTIMR